MNTDTPIFLSATDTTIGLLCADAVRLDAVKRRPSGKPYITVYPSLASFARRYRLPRPWRSTVRRSRRRSFIHPFGHSFRIVSDPRHLLLLHRTGPLFSTSANLSGRDFDPVYARSVADIVIEPLGTPGTPSEILRLGKRRARRLR